MVKLRNEAAGKGGPAVESTDFMRFTNVKRPQVDKIVQDNHDKNPW